MDDLLSALKTGFDLSTKEAKEQIAEWRELILLGEDPEELLHEFGLEPDYVFDLITY